MNAQPNGQAQPRPRTSATNKANLVHGWVNFYENEVRTFVQQKVADAQQGNFLVLPATNRLSCTL